jgi:glycosyltransferase involved in cell wall biosynthesis
MKISILMPTYNGAKYLKQTLESLLHQDFYELIICDDSSTDNTSEIVKKFNDDRIKFFSHDDNIGYPGNLNRCLEKASGEIIFLMGQDDILSENALQKIERAFVDPRIGAVTRPYFWFEKDISRPVRDKRGLNSGKDEIVSIDDSKEKVIRVFDSLDQLSGLAYRREFMDKKFHLDIFPCHIYPFASIFFHHPIVFLCDYTVAVRIESSQSRSLSSIYDKSPLLSWVEMINDIYSGKENIRKYLIHDFVATNYIGLVQIRNFAECKYAWREIWYLLKFRWQNVYSGKFWFFSVGILILPRFVLKKLVDWYKININSKILTKIEFKYRT